MLLSCEKRDKLQKASKACFASTLQRAWTLWGAHVHRQKLLRKALESRQVSMSCLPLCILHNNHKTQFVAGSQSLVISKACLLRLYSMVGLSHPQQKQGDCIRWQLQRVWLGMTKYQPG